MDIGRNEVINILVACNNRDKEWCPYGDNKCECYEHFPRELKEDEFRDFTCTDINDKDRECCLEEVQENPLVKTVYVNIMESVNKMFPKYLTKHLQKNERICPVCHGLGVRIEDNIYGIEGDTSEAGRHKMFPYKKQSLVRCISCYNGVQELCKFCGKPFKQPGHRHCDCEGFKKTEEEKRIKKWEETVTKAKEVQESDVKTYLYCEEFDSYHPDVDDFFEEYEREYSDEEVYTKPDRLWVCSKYEISLDAYNMVESACDELHEDAFSNCEVNNLQKLLDEWCKEQTGTTTYYPCYKEYVKIDWSQHEEAKIY